jgi:hypothetical protein
MSWKNLEQAAPSLAAFGIQRINGKVAYLATIRKDGAPRVHPVTPIIGESRLFIFMEPDSPKGFDLRRDGRYALHASVEDSSGTGGEFRITGHAVLVETAEARELAIRASSYQPADRYILFEFAVEQAASTVYADGEPVRERWVAA